MKNIVYFLITFIICAIAITATMIKIEQYKQNSIPKNEDNIDNKEDAYIENNETANGEIYTSGIDLYGTYNENDLLVKESKEQFNGQEIIIPQIEGLKDKKVEEKINEDIKERIHSFISKNEKSEIKYFIRGNFENAISIEYYLDDGYYFNREKYPYDFYDMNMRLTLNYNLVNGEQLKFEDLFVNEEGMLNVVRNAVFRKYSDGDRGMTGIDFDYNDATEEELEKILKEKDEWFLEDIKHLNENEIYEIVKNFMREGNKIFYFDYRYIYFYYQDILYSLDMINNASDIGIYTKFRTKESIFENDKIGKKNLWTLSKYNPFDFEEYKDEHGSLIDFSCGQLGENLWYDNVICTNENFSYPIEVVEQNYRKLIQDNKEYQNTLLETYKEEASKNKDKFYILLDYISLVKDDVYVGDSTKKNYSDLAVVKKDIFVYEMSRELYETKYKGKVYEMHRDYFELPINYYIRTFYPLYIEASDEVTVTQKGGEPYIIKLSNNRILTKAEDLTNDYEKLYSIIREELSDNYYHYTSEQIEDYMKNLKMVFRIHYGTSYFLNVSSEKYEYVIQLYNSDLKDLLFLMEVEEK